MLQPSGYLNGTQNTRPVFVFLSERGITISSMNEHVPYKVGIDVGTNSVGFAAIEVDGRGMPQRILNSVVYMHDSGVDPEQAKAAVTRLASSGVARRTRRLIQRRRKRLQRLDKRLTGLGWPIVNLEESRDPYLPWNVRARLAQEKLEGEELNEALSIAVRHMARHRGWRSPYVRVESLFQKQPPSDQFTAMKERITETSGVVFDDDATPAEVVVDLGLNPSNRLRSAGSTKYGPKSIKDGVLVAGQDKTGVFGGKLMQTDNAAELMKIGEVQGLPRELVKDLIRWVFESESPVGKAGERAGVDPLPGQTGKRAPKAHPEFQKFRIVSVVANLRIAEGGSSRNLTPEEKTAVIDLLMDDYASDGITWNDVAEKIGVSREALKGTATLSAEGERPSATPPTNTTMRRIYESKIKPLIAWWESADEDQQAALVTALSNADILAETEPGAEAVLEFLGNLDESTLAKLDTLSLPAGRAAYSVDSLQRMTKRMFEDSVDLHQARKIEFGVDDSWTPPAEPIGAGVGNPAVDRVLKIVNRWLLAATAKWGAPESVNIEHVRSGFSSEAMVREYEREQKKRYDRNQRVVEEMRRDLGIQGRTRPSDIARYVALRRQNGQCAYCGGYVSYQNSEMDHIVPRKGEGSTNTRDNLVAVCEICNKSKSNIPFAVWASKSTRAGVSVEEAVERVRGWIDDDGLNKKQNLNFRKDVIARLRRTTEDEPIDGRSMESVAWMANELHHRIEGHFRSRGDDVKVRVFRGSVTSEARKASGLEGKIELIGGGGKTRFDRRHHAIDALTIAVMTDYVAQTLAERDSIRRAEQYANTGQWTWKEYRGKDAAHKQVYGEWLNHMNRLVFLANDALANDEIPVMQNLRLRLGNGTAHDATIRKFAKKRVGDAWTRDEIDQASTAQMWIALSRDPDFSETNGLPENAERKLRIKQTGYGPDDEVSILPKKIAAIPVRHGYAEVGNTIHHARLYKIPGKKTSYGMIRVFSADLLKHQHEDLFNVPLGPESLSMRNAKPSVREAVLSGDAEYLTWVVTGDEFEIDFGAPVFEKDAIGEFRELFPTVNRWRIKGFPTDAKVTLTPHYLSPEGLGKVQSNKGVEQFLSKVGWRVAVSVLFHSSKLSVIRRNALGDVRTESSSGLPVTIELT